MVDIWVYEVKAALTGDVVFYAYKDESKCRADAAARTAQGETVDVRQYERVSGGFVTLYVPEIDRIGCKCGYVSLREAHDDGERNVHGYAPVVGPARSPCRWDHDGPCPVHGDRNAMGVQP